MKKLLSLFLPLYVLHISTIAIAEDSSSPGAVNNQNWRTLMGDEGKKSMGLGGKYAACMRRKYLDLKTAPNGKEAESFNSECKRCFDEPDQPGCNPKFTKDELAGTASEQGGRSDTVSPMSGVEVVPRK